MNTKSDFALEVFFFGLLVSTQLGIWLMKIAS